MSGGLWVISEGSAVGNYKSCKTVKLLAVGSELLDRGLTHGKQLGFRDQQIEKG